MVNLQVQVKDTPYTVKDCTAMKESTWEDFPVKAWGTSKTPTYTVVVQHLENVNRAMPDLDAVAESFQAGKFVIEGNVLGLRAMPPVGVTCDIQLAVLEGETPETFSFVKMVRFSGRVWHRRIEQMFLDKDAIYTLDTADIGNRAKNAVVLQRLLEGLGGRCIVTKELKAAPPKPRAVKEKPTKDQEMLIRGFEYIRLHGPRANNENQMTEWAELQINDPEGPLKSWDRNLVLTSLRSHAGGGNYVKSR